MTSRSETVSQKLGTRDQLGAHLRAHGYPIADSSLDKLCMPSCGEGPPVARWFGRRPLYDFEEGIRWAKARCRPACDARALAAQQRENKSDDNSRAAAPGRG
jgi:hypothetical protein